MKCLVTGGAGFIGSHLVERLILAGHEVVVLDNLSHGKKSNIHPNATFKKMDIRSAKLGKFMREIRPNAVFHLAAQMEVRRSVEEPRFDAEVNILGLVNVMQSAMESGCSQLVFASSGGAAYGEQQEFPATEDHPTVPISPYGVTKRAGELYGGYFATMGLACASMRLANVYGPRQDPHGEAGVVAIFSERLLAGESCIINGNGKQTRDYVFVADVVEAFYTAFYEGLSGPYNVGTAVETDVNELYAAIAKHAGADGTPQHGPAKDGEQMRSVISAAKLDAASDWQVTVQLDEGIKQTVEWFRQQR